MALLLYPNVTVEAQDFSKVKVQTMPNQSMSLKDIIKRFVRREALPQMREGLYVENLGDLEKLARQDITVRMERMEEIKSYISKAEKRMKEKDEAIKKAAAANSPRPGGEASEPPGGGKGAASATPLATPKTD